MEPADLAFAGIARQAELIRGGEVSARELVELYLERIVRIDPHVNAFRIVMAERALAEADQADARRGAGEERPLLGVPIAVKDDTNVSGEVTGRGSRAHGGPEPADDEIVRLLRSAGAIPIGKTHVPELEQWPFTESAAFGTTHNPWDLDRTPGGSSGGSAAAVAAGMAGAATGSDGAGSIRIPAACCGLFGLKPQRGRIPHKHGWHGLSVVGPLTRSVADAALFLEVTGTGQAPRTDRSYVAAPAERPERLRVAFSRALPPLVPARLDPEMDRALEDTAGLLRSLGHEVVQRDPDYRLAQVDVLVRYLSGVADDAAQVARPERLERRTKGVARMGRMLPAAVLERVRGRQAEMIALTNAVLEDADVLMTPALARPAEQVGRWEGRGPLRTLFGPSGVNAFTPFTPPWNATGNPAVSLPAGFSAAGLPLAVQIVGRQNDEWTLLALSARIEEARPWAGARPQIAA